MVTYARHPFIRLVSTYKDKVIDHIKFQHWRNFVNYDPTHPYEVKLPNMLNTKELYVTRYWYVKWAMVVHINIQGPLN